MSKFRFLIDFTSSVLGNKCLKIVCFPDYDVINFEVNLRFPMKPFSQMTQKKSGQKLNILRKKRVFKMK